MWSSLFFKEKPEQEDVGVVEEVAQPVSGRERSLNDRKSFDGVRLIMM